MDQQPTTARLLDGKACAAQIQHEIQQQVEALAARGRVLPHLAVLRVGEDPASESYVRGKRRAAERVGITSRELTFAADVSQAALGDAIDALNADPLVHGILLQLPLPEHLDTIAMLERIDPRKDVDGTHPLSLGRMLAGHRGGFLPCTPRGIMALLERNQVSVAGRNAVVVGRSNIVGKPMAVLLTQAHCTVTLCHTRTADLAAAVRGAELLIVAAGRAALVPGTWIQKGAVVVDAGINRDAQGKLVGDVAFVEAAQRAAAITPVPGGVGPMTVTMLLQQTLEAARAAQP